MTNRIYFDWNDLCRQSDYNHESILILTYALYIGYNKLLAWNSTALMRKLFITYVPNNLNSKRLLIKKQDGLFSKYKVQQPQSYFINPSWMTAICPLSHKIGYLRALSLRNNVTTEPYVPLYYSPAIDKRNLFLEIIENKIIFIPEQIKQNELSS